MHDAQESIEAFLTAAAARTPAPGGGSAAALAGALSAAMGEMVVNYSIGRNDLAAHDAQQRTALAELTRARHLLLALMVEDQSAYQSLAEARKRLGSDADKQRLFDIALLASIRVPQAIGSIAVEILELAQNLVDKSNRFLLSDLAVCCELAMATVRSASYSVRANLPDLSDETDKGKTADTAQRMTDRAIDLIRRIIPAIWARHGKIT